MKKIPLILFKKVVGYSIVDDEDFEGANKLTWTLDYKGYAHGYGKYRRLHRFILKAPPGTVVDHINGDKLDNRRSNLRIVSQSQNLMNMRKLRSDNTSGYKGVSRLKNGSFVPSIHINGKCVTLKVFRDARLAAKAYNKKAKEVYGEYAYLNEVD